MGAAGASAHEEATRARAAAQHLERKAEYATRRAAQFERGGIGENIVAQALAGLTADGYFVIHDRRLPGVGGNIDHLLIGPVGVYVIDTKAWSGPVTLADGVLRCAGRKRQDAVEGVLRQLTAVREVLTARGHGDVPVRGLLALATPVAAQPIVTVADISAVPVDQIASGLRGRRGPIDASTVEAILRVLTMEFPPADATVDLPESLAEHERRTLFDKTTRCLFIDQWRKAGRQRLYLKDDGGAALGWKDLVVGRIAVTTAGEDTLVRAVLANATGAGLDIDDRLLPRIPVNLPGGRLISLVGLRTVFLIGQRWRRGGQDRLYGTWASTNEGVAELGYVDLTTGEIHPASHEPVAQDRDNPQGLLTALLKRRPDA